MIGFLLRKTLYDLWDNMFRIVLLNLGFVAAVAIPIFLPQLAAKFFDSVVLEIALSALGILACSVYLAAAAFSLKSISDYGSFGFGDFFRALKTAWPAGLVMGFFVFVLFIVATVVIPFYLSMESPVAGLALAAVVFWVAIFSLLSFQFYFTVYIRLGSNLKKSFKKCMIISLDNSWFSIFLLLYNAVMLVLSVVFAFIFPGPAAVLLCLDEALRLRLLKYDWLEANPGADRRKIPWDVLLIDEREKTGTRTLKNFIFPWKD
jgi:hypothetical protein